MEKRWKTANAALLFCALCCLIAYDIFGGLPLKGVTSGWFVLLGMVNFCFARAQRIDNMPFVLLMLAGLIFGMCADVLLGVAFMMGILSFALGHICYLAAFFLLNKPHRRDLLFITPIAAVSLFVVAGTPYIRIEDPLLKKLLLGYALIIAAMLGKALSGWQKSRTSRLIALGCAMFWFSDVMLAIDMFGTPGRLTWILCSYTYWPAQCILAHALYHFVCERANA